MNLKPLQSAKVKLNLLSSRENLFTALILLAGFLLRLRQYLTGRSLWLDEAMLSLNIVNRNYSELFHPLDYDQGAPIGFMLVEKTFNLILGRNEFSLRLFPLLIGLASLWLFYLLLKRSVYGAGFWVALTLFAFNPRLIYYSSEVKQYIVDVALTITLLLCALPLFQQASRKAFATLAFVGALALWFSHPSLFVLAGIGLALFISYFQKRDFTALRSIIWMGTLWLADLALLYSLTLSDLRSNSYMHAYWEDAFAPFPPWSDWGWYPIAFQKNMDTQFGFSYAIGLIFILMLAGWIFLFMQKRALAITLAGILFFTLLASSLGLYPVLERMGIFLVPIGILLIGKSLEIPAQRLRAYPIISTITLLVLSGFVLYAPFTRALEQFFTPKYFEHIRPTMEFLQGSWKEGDSLFISNGAVPAFEFYAPMYALNEISYTAGRREDYADPNAILSQIKTFQGHER
ncbi:MAG: glycosyltransferase family 39 protein, partial [Anaerolineales bacterium]